MKHVFLRVVPVIACLSLIPAFADDPPAATQPALEPIELSMRFTPEMANGVSRMWLKYMTPRYELDEQQATAIGEIMSRRLMQVIDEGAPHGSELVEQMLLRSFENDGDEPRFDVESGKRFAETAAPLFPILDRFFTDTSAEISQKMTLSQRLKFTGDVAGARVGLGLFESRMKRWAEGNVGERGNPFWDPTDPAAPPVTHPDGSTEHTELRMAKDQAENQLQWEARAAENWQRYLDRAAEHFQFNESQMASGRSILDECRQRAEAIMTPEWKAAVRENRIQHNLAALMGSVVNEGPVGYWLGQQSQDLRRPLQELGREFRQRIDALADSTQQAAARERVRAFLAERGVE